MSNTNNILAIMRMKKLKSEEITEESSSHLPQALEFPAVNQKMMSSENPAQPSKKPTMAEMMRFCLTRKDSLNNTPR